MRVTGRQRAVVICIASLAACRCAVPAEAPAAAAPPVADARGGERREVLRIDQDLHPDDDYEIVVDAWVRDGDEIVDVRMGWVDTADADRRSPFGRGVRRHLELSYECRGPRQWTVRLGTDERSHALAIEMDPAGVVRAVARVHTVNAMIERCRVDHGALVTKRVLGIPVGLGRIAVACVDEAGAAHEGELAETNP